MSMNDRNKLYRVINVSDDDEIGLIETMIPLDVLIAAAKGLQLRFEQTDAPYHLNTTESGARREAWVRKMFTERFGSGDD